MPVKSNLKFFIENKIVLDKLYGKLIAHFIAKPMLHLQKGKPLA